MFWIKAGILVLMILPGSFCVIANAQNETEKTSTNAIERIQRESRGNVRIEVADNILQLIMGDQDSKTKVSGPVIKPGINKLTGYRIQVFSDGRNQHSLESRAKARGNAIASMFPKYRGQVYTQSNAPNWYTRVGNFRTQAEAESALTELKRAFPQFASEMRVVKSQIVVVK